MCKFPKKEQENIFNELNEYLYNSKRFCYINNDKIEELKEFMFIYIKENYEIFLSTKNIEKIGQLIEAETSNNYDNNYIDYIDEILDEYIEIFFDRNYDDFFQEILNSKILELFRQSINIFLCNPDIDYNEYYEKLDETMIESM